MVDYNTNIQTNGRGFMQQRMFKYNEVIVNIMFFGDNNDN
jgi:hypothetical protein